MNFSFPPISSLFLTCVVAFATSIFFTQIDIFRPLIHSPISLCLPSFSSTLRQLLTSFHILIYYFQGTCLCSLPSQSLCLMSFSSSIKISHSLIILFLIFFAFPGTNLWYFPFPSPPHPLLPQPTCSTHPRSLPCSSIPPPLLPLSTCSNFQRYNLSPFHFIIRNIFPLS